MMTKIKVSFWIILLCCFGLSLTAFSQSDKSDYYRGLDLYHKGDYASAIQAFELQLKKTPDDASVHQCLSL